MIKKLIFFTAIFAQTFAVEISIPPELKQFIPFDESLLIKFDLSPTHGALGISSKGNYDYYKRIYEKNYFTKMEISPTPIIPKTIHIIWLGSSFPEKYHKNFESWKLHHPDWQVILWTDKDVAQLKLINRDLYNQSRNYGQRADILRLELLNTFGGLYADVDMVCLKPFDILHHCYDFYTGIISAPGPLVVANGLMASSKGHPIIQHAVHNLRANINRYGLHQNIMNATGPYYFTRCIYEAGPGNDDKIIMLPCSFIYPSPNTKRLETEESMDKDIRPESFTNHYWTCSWQKDEAKVH